MWRAHRQLRSPPCRHPDQPPHEPRTARQRPVHPAGSRCSCSAFFYPRTGRLRASECRHLRAKDSRANQLAETAQPTRTPHDAARAWTAAAHAASGIRVASRALAGLVHRGWVQGVCSGPGTMGVAPHARGMWWRTSSHTAPPDSRPSAAARALDGQTGFLAALRARYAPLPPFQPVARIALPAQADRFELRACRSYAWRSRW